MKIKSEIGFFYDALMKYSAFFGSVVFWGVAAVILLILNQVTFSIKFTIAAIISMLIEHLIKLFYKSKRPDFKEIKTDSLYAKFQEKTSFPSGHSAIMAVFTTMIHFEYRLIYLTSFFVLLSLLAGLARIYLKRHHLKDVIVGYIIGFLIGYLI